MSNQMQEDLKPPREKWLVFLFIFWSVGFNYNGNMPPFGNLKITDQKLIVKSPFDIAYGSFQFTPQQLSKISSSKAIYFMYIPQLLLLFGYILFVFIVFEDPTPLIVLTIVIVALILGIIPILSFKSFRIRHNVGAYPSHIYFFCLRRHFSSIVDALTRCGFEDKLEQPSSSPH